MNLSSKLVAMVGQPPKRARNIKKQSNDNGIFTE